MAKIPQWCIIILMAMFDRIFPREPSPGPIPGQMPGRSVEKTTEQRLRDVVNARVRFSEGITGRAAPEDNAKISEKDREIAPLLDELRWTPRQFVAKCLEWRISSGSIMQLLFGLNFSKPQIDALLGRREN